MSDCDQEAEDSADAESSDYDDDEDYDQNEYYANVDEDEGMASDKEEDPESFLYTVIEAGEAEEMLDCVVAKASIAMKVFTKVRLMELSIDAPMYLVLTFHFHSSLL